MGIVRKQSVISTIIIYSGVLIGFVTTGLLFPKFLSTDEVGLLNLLNSYGLLLAQFATLGVNGISSRLFPYFKNNTNHNNGYFTLITLVPLVGYILVMLVFTLLKPFIIQNNIEKSALFVNYIFLIYYLTLVLLFFSVWEIYLSILKDVIISSFLREFLQRLLILVSITILAYSIVSINTFIYLYVVSLTIPSIIIFVYLIKRRQVYFFPIKIPSNLTLKHISSVSFFSILSGVSTILILSLDRIMVNRFIDLNATGIYSICYFFGTIVLIPSRPLKKITAPLLAQAWKDNNKTTIKDIYSKSCINQYIVGLCIFLLIVLNIDNIFDILPKQYAPGRYVIILIAMANLLDMGTGVNSNIISMSKYYKFTTYFNVLLGLLIIVTNLIFIPKIGITGAALATLISIAILNMLRFVFLYLKFKFQPFDIKFLLVTIIGIFLYFAIHYIPKADSVYLDISIRTAPFLVGYGGLIILSKSSSDINTFYRQIIEKLRKK